MLKKSVEILNLPVISITEGRELGTSKSLLIDAKNGVVAAITIEDEDWYRGVKLLPYSSVIAIGEDAVTITNSENILTLEDASDYETMLDANVRIIGTKAITKTGTIQGKVSEIFVGEGGRIEKCALVDENGGATEISADQISIFGKQVTVIDADVEAEKKTEELSAPEPAAEAAPVVEETPVVEEEPAAEAPVEEEPAVEEVVEEVVEETVEEAAPEIPVIEEPQETAESAADRATEERHRRFLLGKKVVRPVATASGFVIAEVGATVTEEILQKAKLANKIVELSMNVQ
ncbi:MAG: PRC-barrel domain-containing protein [Selenomonadaceae bacterium]|nr:PRC-barrel domain-containing protein [Selenomonadaceae bacterium]